MKFSTRRIINSALLVLAVLVFWFWLRDAERNLFVSEYLSGWALLGATVLLGAYNLRKKLTVLPVLSNALWLQLHLYLGLFSIWLFLEHTGWGVPDGPLEILLSILFSLVALSGLAGILLSRALPKRLRATGEELIYERIPYFRQKIREEAEASLVNLVREQPETTLKNYYVERLNAFFSSPAKFHTYLFSSHAYINEVIGELKREERYFNHEERLFSENLQAMIRKKYEIELHYVYQSVLRYWLFVHVPVTYSMYILVLVHLVTAYAFRSTH